MALTIKTHGRYYFKHGDSRGEKDFAIDFRSPSMDVFRETHRKYIGTEESDDPRNPGSVPKFRENTFFNIRGLLKKRYLPKIMLTRTKDYPNFVRVKFVVIDEILDDSGKEMINIPDGKGGFMPLPVDLQSRSQLAATIRRDRMPIDPDDYLEIDELRSDIREYVEDPDHFLKVIKPRKDARRGAEREIMELNGLIPAKKTDGNGILD